MLWLYRFSYPLKSSHVFQHTCILGDLKELNGQLSTAPLTCRASVVSLDDVCKMDTYFSSTRIKTKPLAHVINSCCRCPLGGLPHVCRCFIFTDTQLPLGFMITARWFLSVLCLLSISIVDILMCVYSAAEEELVSAERTDQTCWRFALTCQEICNFISKL